VKPSPLLKGKCNINVDCLPLFILHRAGAGRVAYIHADHQLLEILMLPVFFKHFMELLLEYGVKSVLRGHLNKIVPFNNVLWHVINSVTKMEDEEWEAVNIYIAFAFEKR